MAALVLVLSLAPGMAQEKDKPETSKEVYYATYSEKVDRVTVILSSYMTGMDSQQQFAPLQIAVGAWGKGPEVLVKRDSFLLLDADGNMYTTAAAGEINSRSSLIRQVDAMAGTQPLQTGNEFVNFHQVQSLLYTAQGAGDAQVPLDSNNYLSDIIWFAVPPDGFSGVMTLRFQTDSMTGPVDVRFEVPEFKKHKKKKKAES